MTARDLPPAEKPVAETIPGFEATLATLIAAYGVTMSLRDTARALGLVRSYGASKGDPVTRLVLDMVRNGRLAPVDPDQPQHRWVFASAAIAVYILGGV